MKKVLVLFIIIFAVSSSLFAYEYKVGDVQSRFNSESNMAVMPYSGAFGVNLRDAESYPVRNENVEHKSGSIIKNDTSHYFDDQMVANGIIEGIFKENEFGEWKPNLDGGDRYRYRLLQISSMTLRVDCSSDFMFVSQSDDSYKRPFYLYVLPRAVSGDSQYAGDPSGSIAPILVKDSSPVEIPAPSNFDDYTSIWFDLILALPGEVTDEGVTVENVFYPLSDADDYTAEVTITIKWTGTYCIEHTAYYNYRWDSRLYDVDTLGTEPVTIERTMTIPFSGYCSFDAPESVGSLYISTTSESQEINLAPDTASSVKVADISYLVNFGHGLSGLQPAYDDSKAWMFLSASPDPGSSLQDGFRLVNQNATGNLTDYNSVPFLVTVEGNGEFKEFDGRAKARDFSPGGGTSDEYIGTACIWQQHRFNSTHSSTQYYHSHNFDGEVFVEVVPKSDLIAPGRYVGEIYVHVITNGD